MALAGCGGGNGPKKVRAPTVQTVRGEGFRFEAPVGWTVTSANGSVTATPKPGGDTLVKVFTFRTVKPFDPSRWAAAVVELDRSARQLAAGLKGRLDSARTIEVAGGRARQYALSYSGKAGEYTFLYRGRREFELICQWAGSRPEACSRLVASFRPA